MATKKGETDLREVNEHKGDDKPRICFVIMPISDSDEYGPGHFRRVYDYIIKPACKKAGFEPLRADEVKGTQVIVIDILQRIINSEMAICDLSSRNPNVLYELGIRQSFDLPVTLIKDDVTPRIFDIQGFRDVFYHSNLRIDEVNKAVNELAEAIEETYNNKGKEVNSIVELLGISKASVKDPIHISPENSVLLDAIQQLRSDMLTSPKVSANAVVLKEAHKFYGGNTIGSVKLPNGQFISLGDRIAHSKFRRGTVVHFPPSPNLSTHIVIEFDDPKIGTKTIDSTDKMVLLPSIGE